MNRKEFIKILFKKYLNNYPYTILKYNIENISTLNEYSDIDLAIYIKDINFIIKKILSDKTISKHRIFKKSFMCIIELYFRDGSFLSIDLIHSFRRKDINYINIDEFINSSTINHESIKIPSPEYNFLYILFFYHLNNKNIEKKYVDFFENLSTNDKGNIVEFLNEKFQLSYSELNYFYKINSELQKSIVNYINTENTNFVKVKNSIFYFMDLYNNSKQYRYINIQSVSTELFAEITKILRTKYRKELVIIDSSKLSFVNLLKLKLKTKLKGYYLIDNSTNKITLSKSSGFKNLDDFEKKYIEMI